MVTKTQLEDLGWRAPQSTGEVGFYKFGDGSANDWSLYFTHSNLITIYRIGASMTATFPNTVENVKKIMSMFDIC